MTDQEIWRRLFNEQDSLTVVGVKASRQAVGGTAREREPKKRVTRCKSPVLTLLRTVPWQGLSKEDETVLEQDQRQT